MKRFLIIGLILMAAMSLTLSAQEQRDEDGFKKYLDGARTLFQEQKHDELIKLIDDGFEKFPAFKSELYDIKFQILGGLKKYNEALAVGLEGDKFDKEKTDHKAISIAIVYMRINDTDNAFKWLNTAAERGFTGVDRLQGDPTFDALKKDKRFEALVKKVNENIGIGKPVKEFSLKDLTGNDVSIAKYKGKVLLLDFWATWCGPCVREVPSLVKDYAELHPKGFEIIGISLDNDRAKLDAFLNEHKMTWPITFSGKGWSDDTAALYGVRSIPSTWLLDKKGNLRYFGVRGEELKKAIETLLAE